MRALGITVLSLTLTAGVIGNAYIQKKQFYPSVVYITKSNLSMAVIYIQAFIMVFLMGKLMKKVFFGQLRAAEFEHLMERSWYAITETCLAFTVLRDDFNPQFVAFFTMLLFLKSFHWLAEDRVDFMERSPVIGLLFHIRVQSLLLVLAALDLFFIYYAYQSTIAKGASVQLVFGFEYAILLIMIFNISVKYLLHAIDARWESPWENKAVVLLYTELIVGFFKVLLYVSFVAIMVRKYTLPLFAFRPMYYTMRNFKKAFNDVILSRRAIRNMNTLYPDATRAELAAVDNVCIICREEMNTGAKKLPCNHIFHAACLRSWFQRQQTCPTCRLNILQGAVVPAPAAQAQRAAGEGAPAPPAAPQPAPRPQQQQPQLPHNMANLRGTFGAIPTMPPMNNMPPMPGMPGIPGMSGMPGMTGMPGMSGMPGMPGLPGMPNMANLPPFMGFPFPPPPMPPNLNTLTPAELARMEGRGREHIEARIQCLQNIQTMLDASVMMMQQYSAIANRYPTISKEVGTQTTEEANGVGEPVEVNADSTDTQSKETDSKISINDTPGTSGISQKVEPIKVLQNKDDGGVEIAVEVVEVIADKVDELKEQQSAPMESSAADKDAAQNADDSLSSKSDEDQADANELRRRRLQKFNQEH